MRPLVQLHVFPQHELHPRVRDPGEVSPGPCPTRDQAHVDGIGYVGKDDRGRARRRFGRTRRRDPGGDKHVDREPDQFSGFGRERLEFALPGAGLDHDVLPLDIAHLAQPLQKGVSDVEGRVALP